MAKNFVRVVALEAMLLGLAVLALPYVHKYEVTQCHYIATTNMAAQGAAVCKFARAQ